MKPTKWALLEREGRCIRLNFQKTIHYACTPKLLIRTSPGGDTTVVKYKKKTTNNEKIHFHSTYHTARPVPGDDFDGFWSFCHVSLQHLGGIPIIHAETICHGNEKCMRARYSISTYASAGCSEVLQCIWVIGGSRWFLEKLTFFLKHAAEDCLHIVSNVTYNEWRAVHASAARMHGEETRQGTVAAVTLFEFWQRCPMICSLLLLLLSLHCSGFFFYGIKFV